MRRLLLLFALGLAWHAVTASPAFACRFTPLEWQQSVRQHSFTAFVDQRKHTTWVRDRDRTFIDDEIEARFRPGEIVDVVVDLNRCMKPAEIREALSGFGRLTYIGKLVTVALLEGVRYEDLTKLAARPDVAMVEWQAPMYWTNDISSRALQSRASATFSPNTAQEAGFTGAGVNIAIVDSGVDDAHETFAGKFVAGFDGSRFEDTNGNSIDDSCEGAPLGNGVCTDPNDEPADGSTNPPDVIGHGTHVAGIALGAGAAGRVCSTPDDGSPTNCAGVASGAGLVDVKIDDTGSQANAMEAIDWVGLMAATLNIRAANMSFGYCVDDDGTGSHAQQVNYLAALGVVSAVAHGNAANCFVAPGTVRTSSPGSASYAITVGGTDDRNTVARNDDTNYSSFMQGPRLDFNAMTPDLLALKPDLSAPGENVFSAQAGTVSSYVSKSGTSMASPQVAGAAAVVLQARPTIHPDSLKDLLKRNADTSLNTAQFPAVDPVWDDDLGSGMVNLWAALNAAAAADVRFPSCIGPPSMPGQPCALSGGMPPWNNTADISTSAPPQVGVANTLTAQVRNASGVPATVLVNFGVYVFAAGNNQFFHVGTQQVTIPAMTTVAVSQPWTPAASNHQCAQVSIAFGLDTDFNNNVTQRNLQVAPSVFEVQIENPFMVPARMRLEAKSRREGWRCSIDQTEFVIDPLQDCPRQVRVNFDAPANTRPGERADCDVAVFATPRGQQRAVLVGGVTAQTFVPKPCRLMASVVDKAGKPVSRAKVTFGTAATETDNEGVFSVTVRPYARQVVSVESNQGRGRVEARPVCGVGRLKLVLSRQALEVVPGPVEWTDLGVDRPR